MTEKQTSPYGSWASPITSDLIVGETISVSTPTFDGDDIYWGEGRPAEGGRVVLVRRSPDGSTADITPAPFNGRSRVHEYGGGAYTVHNGVVYFSNFADNRLYRIDRDREPRPITPESALRYADMAVDDRRQRLICVREDHRETGREAVNTIVAVPTSGDGDQQVLVSGNDFYSSPRLSPDGSTLAWLTWNHPNMPWDGTELWTGTIAADGSIENARLVAGGAEESIFQPTWSPDGTLYFVSDRTDWWNIYRERDGRIEAVTEREVEFGLPQWAFGMSTYGFESAARIICVYQHEGDSHLARLDTGTGEITNLDVPYTSAGSIKVSPNRAIFVAASPTESSAVVLMNLDSGEQQVLRRSSDTDIDPGYISVAEAIEFPTENGKTAHGFFYPPVNRDYQAPSGELPPLIVESHGGPTGATSRAFDLGVQYWTSRGFAVVDVNYGGSTGYGREYRQRLNGEWGVVDVDDCANAARYLADQGKVDPDRLVIRGGSAGGYTTLCALTFRKVFAAGASYFGLGDLEQFVGDTHKFESRYLERLVGPFPEQRELYRQRSAINFTDQISCPVILFQGLDDKVVPSNQAELMVEAMQAKGLPHAYVAFEGEGHGFRKAENIKRSMDGELYFYSRIFGFPLAQEVEPVPIEHLPAPVA